MASNSYGNFDTSAYASMHSMPTTFDARFSGYSSETIRLSNGDDSNESISSLQPLEYRYTRRGLQHHGSSESSLASAPSSYSPAFANDAGVPNEPHFDNLYEPVNQPINFNIHPMGVREDLNGSGQLDSGLSQTRSDQSLPETEILRQQLYIVTNELRRYQDVAKYYHEKYILESARCKALLTTNDALKQKLNEYASWLQIQRQLYQSPGNIANNALVNQMAFAIPPNGNARTFMSPTSPRSPGIHQNQRASPRSPETHQNQRTPPPYPGIHQNQRTSPRSPETHQNQRTPPPYPGYFQRPSKSQMSTNINSNSNSNLTGSPGLIERKTFQNVDNGQLEFLKAEHLSTLESHAAMAAENSNPLSEQDWSGLDYKAGSQSLISLLSEGSGIRYQGQNHNDTHADILDSGEESDSEELRIEQSIINAYYPIDSNRKLSWKFIIRSETCYHANKKLSIALMDAECNLPEIPRLKIYFRVNLTSNKGDWAHGQNTKLFPITQNIPINQVLTFTLLNDNLDDFVINLSVCTEIEPNDSKVSLGVLSANPPNCLNGVRSYEVTCDNVKTWNQVLSSLKRYRTKSVDLSHVTRRNTNKEEETNVTYRYSMPIKKLELETDTSNPSSYVSCIDQEIILQNRTHSYSNLSQVGVKPGGDKDNENNNENNDENYNIAALPTQMKEVNLPSRAQSYGSLKYSEIESNDEDDHHRCTSSISKLSIKAKSQSNVNSLQNQKVSLEGDPKGAAPTRRSKSKETLSSNENSRSSRRSFKSFLKRNHKKKHSDTIV